ncbi:MAG TPA: alpha/beta hydrolase [Dehalococcoidia bacterium]|nr:alpha/beta hydrolase [Dehalococcoidia bacterium]
MPFLPLEGCDRYYETHGAGPALLFAHGLGGSQLSWWQQVPAFQDRYTCITFAHRGFALSRTRPGGEPGPEAFVSDLAALIEHLRLADVRLVAQSMGGWSCLDYVLREPGRVKALVMAGSTGTATSPELQRIFAAHATAEPERALFERGIHPAAGERMAGEQPALHFLYRAIDAETVGLDKMALRARLIAARTTTPAQLATLRLPVLCISGEEDAVMPTAAVAAFAALLPNARLEKVPKAGHSTYFERPAAFNALLDTCLRAVDG